MSTWLEQLHRSVEQELTHPAGAMGDPLSECLAAQVCSANAPTTEPAEALAKHGATWPTPLRRWAGAVALAGLACLAALLAGCGGGHADPECEALHTAVAEGRTPTPLTTAQWAKLQACGLVPRWDTVPPACVANPRACL